MCLEKHKCLKHLRPTVSTVSDKEDMSDYSQNWRRHRIKNIECINRVARECL